MKCWIPISDIIIPDLDLMVYNLQTTELEENKEVCRNKRGGEKMKSKDTDTNTVHERSWKSMLNKKCLLGCKKLYIYNKNKRSSAHSQRQAEFIGKRRKR